METVIVMSNPAEKGYPISAHYFNALPDNIKKLMKSYLFCDLCKEQAIFRKKSKNGKKECFYANHKKGCKNSSIFSWKKENIEQEETNLMEQTDLYEIVFLDCSPYRKNAQDDIPEESTELKLEDPSQTITYKKHTKNPAKIKNKKMTIKTILKYAEKGILNTEKMIIQIPEHNNYKYNLGKITHNANTLKDYSYLIGKEHFYWGIIKSTDMKIWLNFSGDNNISISLSDDISDSFFRRLNLTKYNCKKINVPVICFGKLKVGSSGKMYIKINKLKNLYIDTNNLKIEI